MTGFEIACAIAGIVGSVVVCLWARRKVRLDAEKERRFQASIAAQLREFAKKEMGR